eukprot:TRINITY_DN4625_c0_g1_i6.p2 TRINITY_DN4625_c0_g1~~TRINITY_DN4625_c0_g1_i6.p2  ORF type:complete len:387 (+),score=99.08 TRINITY_DN4625_c0_g1_i6:2140-3300(+)
MVTEELESFKNIQMAEDCLWRITKVAMDKRGVFDDGGVVTQDDVDIVSRRAEEHELRGELAKASKKYKLARELQQQVDRVKHAAERKRLQQRQRPELSPRRKGRGWVKLPQRAGCGFYYGIESGKTSWIHPENDDESETGTPVTVPIEAPELGEWLSRVTSQDKTCLVMDAWNGPLVHKLRMQQVPFVSHDSSADDLNRELKKAMKYGTPIVFDAHQILPSVAEREFSLVDSNNDSGLSRQEFSSAYGEKSAGEFDLVDTNSDGEISIDEYVAVYGDGGRKGLKDRSTRQFDELHTGLLELLTCSRGELTKVDYFNILEVSVLERKIFGTGKISPDFCFIWLQSERGELPKWCTAKSSVVLTNYRKYWIREYFLDWKQEYYVNWKK